ncbi:glycoside hydrolase family 2 protein [Edaphobacter sp.]|uniref:glycoside hydrolase family 2 protein n=1 Tax=Edaphobacter sp. TaxID=1934404 RepID=UPI002DBF1429|nr:glycoside hydrolase family 2 TIM barrel-domain containing protein [Edaphobacter sp.]HEU5340436.1 glycoside hydrolase family 2 TIM barrel-domain containing protein [Edaphobacter sp.]
MMKTAPSSRRSFIRNCVASAAAITAAPILSGWTLKGTPIPGRRGPATRTFSLNQKWLFGGKFDASALSPDFNDVSFTRVTLPHCVAELSWENWDPAQWEDVWIYRRHFALPDAHQGNRAFLHFDRVMAAAAPTLNGHALPKHLGGYLPFNDEITHLLEESNTLAVQVDSRWLPIPPAGSPKGISACDYYLPGGMTGPVELRFVPQVFISDVFARPFNVLSSERHLEIKCTVDAADVPDGNFRMEASLWANVKAAAKKIAVTSNDIAIERRGENEITFNLTGLKDVALWDIDAPHLYELIVTLVHNGQPIHDYRTRVGFREARFGVDGFFLNGRRLRLFGLNRHEIYPYAGYAMPPRVMRRDAEILKHEFNCNIIRCSHYPQSPAFLDACDELGLMVWEETPGWGYLGDDQWQEIVVQNVHDMVRRDRNRPSVVIWGVRVNGSRNDPTLYIRTRNLAKDLDGSRPTSGSMTSGSMKTWKELWHQDVFALDDYHSAADGSVGLTPPLPGVPFFFSETVGQFNYPRGHGFDNIYRRAGDPAVQQQQAIFHAQAHDRAASFPRCGGAIAWCAFEYASPVNPYQGVKCPGVADVFRIPKLGASFYQSQVDPKVRVVIEPNFYWDFGPRTPGGPGEHAAIFSNCDRIELTIDGNKRAVLHPDRAAFAQLKYPPFFADLNLDGSAKPTLRIDGYIGNRLALSRSLSSDPAHDRLVLHLDDRELEGDGIDATRLTFSVTDRFGAQRPFVTGEVAFQILGPVTIVGDNPFHLEDSGGSGAVWIKSIPDRSGQVVIRATHSQLGTRTVELSVRTARIARL